MSNDQINQQNTEGKVLNAEQNTEDVEGHKVLQQGSDARVLNAEHDADDDVEGHKVL